MGEDSMKQENVSRKILLVDDEENITRSLIRVLRRDDYHIFTANSGKEGLDVLKENDIGVIISDQRMPEMSGTEFLSQVSKLYPDTIRIVLSGYTDLNSVTDAINEGKIYKFLTKPWDDKLLRQNIEEAFYQYELVGENKRLSSELTRANEELTRANIRLENNVKVEARHAELNLRSLQVAQDMLLNLPVGIIGIDEDGVVVFANDRAHKIVSRNDNGLIGLSYSELFNSKIQSYKDQLEMNDTRCLLKPQEEIDCNVILHKYRMLNDSVVMIVVLTPTDGECDG